LEGRLTMPVRGQQEEKLLDDLESILSGSEVEATEEVTEEPTPEPTGEAEQTEEPKEEPSKQQEEDSTPEPKTQDEGQWRYEAYKDEKRKRQSLEKELEELRQQMSGKEESQKAPDVLDDQEAYTNYINSSIQQATFTNRTEMSKFHADREFGADVVMQKLDDFKELVAKDNTLNNEVLNSPSPYYTMIEIVDKAQKFEELQNVDQLEAKIRAEIEEKVRKEIESEVNEKKSKRESVTPSLNSSASVKGSPEGDANDLKSILGR